MKTNATLETLTNQIKDMLSEMVIYAILIAGTILILAAIAKIIANKIREEQIESKRIEKWIAQKKAEKEAQQRQDKPIENKTPLAIAEKSNRDDALFIEHLSASKENKWGKSIREYENEDSQYTVKKPMTWTESKLYFRLVKALPEYIVLAQVQMTSFLEPKARKWTPNHAQQLNKIIRKSIDFIVTDTSGKSITAIELQDWTHNRKDRQKNDEFKRQTLSAAGIRFIEFHAENMPSIEEIKSHFNANATPAAAHLPLTPENPPLPPPAL
jgi:hypothetical protein